MTTGRRNSLVLPPQPPPAPIPPSLKQSPYLKAHIFTANIATPRLPNDAAERWLQDTVPIQSTHAEESTSAKSQDRRGSIVHKQPSLPPTATRPRPQSYVGSGPITPVADATASSPIVTGLNRGRSLTSRYLAHSLAPPPDVDDQFTLSPCRSPTAYTTPRPAYIPQARSAPNIHRVGAENGDHAQNQRNSYFSPPPIPPMR